MTQWTIATSAYVAQYQTLNFVTSCMSLFLNGFMMPSYLNLIICSLSVCLSLFGHSSGCGWTSENDIQCDCVATYTVTFRTLWSAQSHPKDYPRSAHWSPLVGGSHNSNYTMWAPGGMSSRGVQNVAEFGGTSTLCNEMQQSRSVYDTLRLSGISPGTGTRTGQLTLGCSYSLVSLVSMIAPSPDWIVGVHSLNLRNGTSWISSYSVDLFPYDAGTDSGLTFTAPNQRTNPKEPIYRLTETNPDDQRSSFYGTRMVARMAVLNFDLLSQTCPTSPPKSLPTPSPSVETVQTSESTVCNGTISYLIRFQGMWSNDTLPRQFPPKARFSHLTGGSHSSNYTLWRPGDRVVAKSVIDLVSKGQNKGLKKAMKKDKRVLHVVALKGKSGARRTKRQIDLDASHTFVSLMGKITPSPDWFIGVSHVNLCNNVTGWVTKHSVDLFPYDAGLNSQVTFVKSRTSMSSKLQEPEPIYRITGSKPNNSEGSFYGYNPVPRLGVLTFQKM